MAWQETPFHPPETQLSLEEALEVPMVTKTMPVRLAVKPPPIDG